MEKLSYKDYYYCHGNQPKSVAHIKKLFEDKIRLTNNEIIASLRRKDYKYIKYRVRFFSFGSDRKAFLNKFGKSLNKSQLYFRTRFFRSF
jgi:hypothetical protein